VTTDAKIHDIAVVKIRRRCMNPEEWRFTVIGGPHPSLGAHLALADGELVLASGFFSAASWYAFTTRRIVSQFQGAIQSLDPSQGISAQFGSFIGSRDGHPRLGSVCRGGATITAASSGAVLRLEYETGVAAMAPLYAAMYWEQKHRFLDKLITSSEREAYKARNG
jgi:hypothetical protein